jgi:hypothetical protein
MMSRAEAAKAVSVMDYDFFSAIHPTDEWDVHTTRVWWRLDLDVSGALRTMGP